MSKESQTQVARIKRQRKEIRSMELFGQRIDEPRNDAEEEAANDLIFWRSRYFRGQSGKRDCRPEISSYVVSAALVRRGQAK